jgi:hypothetical protein
MCVNKLQSSFILHASSYKRQNRHTRAKGVKEVAATTTAMQETAARAHHTMLMFNHQAVA